MNMATLKRVAVLGQSLWHDYIRRDLITSGELHRRIAAGGLRGMTSNPAIFEQAIGESDLYDEAIQALAKAGQAPQAIYEALSQGDVRDAADAFRTVYEATLGLDGFVSLEVNPHLARDTQGTLEEARRLWAALDRPNVMIKVPATVEGLPAIHQLLKEGVNVNITLLFAVPRYREVAQAYLSAQVYRMAEGLPVDRVASVASFFVSRIDALVDPLLAALVAEGGPEAGLAGELLGQVAIAQAKLAYQAFQELYATPGGRALRVAGGRVQRLLWASTSTKNPEYHDLKYVEALMGPQTVDTLPLPTLDAYAEHGAPRVRVDQNVPAARRVLEQAAALGLRMEVLAQQLEEEGVLKFRQPFDQLLATLARKASGAA